MAPGIGLEQQLPCIGSSVNPSRENFQGSGSFLQEQEDWSRREENSLGADLEDVEDLRPDQWRGGPR
jgi:hypothetical protein